MLTVLPLDVKAWLGPFPLPENPPAPSCPKCADNCPDTDVSGARSVSSTVTFCGTTHTGPSSSILTCTIVSMVSPSPSIAETPNSIDTESLLSLASGWPNVPFKVNSYDPSSLIAIVNIDWPFAFPVYVLVTLSYVIFTG